MKGMDYFTCGSVILCIVFWGIVLAIAHWRSGK